MTPEEIAEFKSLCAFQLRWVNGDQGEIFWQHHEDRLLELARKAAEVL